MTPQLYRGDCLEVMQGLPDGSVDMVLCDLPYGLTEKKWDAVIPFGSLWMAYNRVARPGAAMVFTASQPFTSALVASNFKHFRYQFIWEKDRPSNPQLAKHQPLKIHEDILVFYTKFGAYEPQGTVLIPAANRKVHLPETNSLGNVRNRREHTQTHTNYPRSILRFRSERGFHPTQKPVSLFSYLIRTYTKPGHVVLDNCMGSGTTGVACRETGRRFIGIEKDARYFDMSRRRIFGLGCALADYQKSVEALVAATACDG